MNESTSNFEYAVDTSRARCDYSKFKNVWLETASKLDWFFSKSEIPWSSYEGDLYLFVCEKIPGSSERRFISCNPVNADEMKLAFQQKQTLKQMFEHFNLVEAISGFLDNRPWVNGVKHSDMLKTMFIQPTYGGSVSGNGSMPLGEDLIERLELAYRGGFFTELWVYLYEEHEGESLLVDIDYDDPDGHETFELHSAMRVSSNRTLYEEQKKHVIEIEGHNLSELAKLLDALGKHGNGGHSFEYKLNDKKFYFDGDGQDHIFRVRLLTESK